MVRVSSCALSSLRRDPKLNSVIEKVVQSLVSSSPLRVSRLGFSAEEWQVLERMGVALQGGFARAANEVSSGLASQREAFHLARDLS